MAAGLVAAGLAGLASGTPAEAVNGGAATDYGFVASIQVGEAQRGCSGSLVDIEWVLTVASCFAGVDPATAKTVTLGNGEQRTVAEIQTNPAGTLSLAKLSSPVADVTPVAISGTAPSAGETLQAAGVGRTATDWVPAKAQTAGLTVQAVGDSTINLSGAAPLCQGDAGGPALRVTASGPELVAVHSAGYQKGCLEAPASETRTQTTEVRVDSNLTWVRQNIRPGTFVRLATSAGVLDTRTGVGATAGARAAGATTTFAVAGVGGVPATGVTAVLIDITALPSSTTGTYLTVFPAGATRDPALSMVNANAGQIISNTAIVPVPASGKISVYNQTAGNQIVADVEGYYTSTPAAGTGFVPVEPTRLVDTRSGLGGFTGTIPTGGSHVFTLTGGVVPAGAQAVFLDLIVTGATGYGWIGTYPAGGANRSVMDYVPGTMAHGISARLGSDGKATFTNNSGSAVSLVMTAEGYYTGSATTGSVLRTVTAKRLLDTRSDGAKAPLAANATVDVATGYPAGSTVALNLTVVGNTTSGYLHVWPVDGTEPTASLVNYPDTGARAGLALVKVGTGGKVRIRNNSAGTTHVLADIQGWFANDQVVPAASTGGSGNTAPIADAPTEANGGSLLEPFTYPFASDIQASDGITLVRGDGHLVHASCSTPASGDVGVLRVWSTDALGEAGDGQVCFQVRSTPAVLVLQVPDVYEIRGDGLHTGAGHTVNATVTDDNGQQSTVAVDKDGSTQVGVGADPNASPTALLKLVATS
jgi:hypothetical protein